MSWNKTPNTAFYYKSMKYANSCFCSIITPTMLRNIDAESFQQQAQSMFNDYKGMVIGIGHATDIETDDQINISVVPGDVNKYAVRIQGHTIIISEGLAISSCC